MHILCSYTIELSLYLKLIQKYIYKKIINKLIIFRAKFAYACNAYNMCAGTHKNEIVPISFRI